MASDLYESTHANVTALISSTSDSKNQKFES